MTLNRLRGLACDFFKVTLEDFKNSNKDKVAIARHCFRAAAWNKYGVLKKHIADFEGKTQQPILRSCNIIINEGISKDAYDGFVDFCEIHDKPHVDVVVSEDGIARITNEAFDDRFYRHPTKINSRTGLPFFPAFHYITGEGEPTPYGLLEWYKQMGFRANEILERSKIIGSYVHNMIDMMIQSDIEVSAEDIHTAFPHAKEAQKVKECFLGFLNFMRDEEPEIVASEKMDCGEDFGFTIDNMFRIKSDKYKNLWASDWKTSKTASESHKMQVESMRRVTGCDRGMVVVLGNSSKNKYTVTKIPIKRHDYYWDRFLAIKETAYVEILDKGRIQPREDSMPAVFSLKDINIKRKL